MMSRVYQGPNDHLTPEEKSDLALYDALLAGDLEEVRHIFQRTKRNLNQFFSIVRREDEMFTTPICLVSSNGPAMMLKFLIEAGCNVNIRSIIFKRTAAHVAVLNNNVGCLQLLITAQAKLDFQDVAGNSPCHYAAELGFLDMLDIMIRIGTQINSQDITGKTSLMRAVRNNKVEAALRLIRANANVNIVDNNNELALHFAARNGSTQLVGILLSAGSLVNIQNKWGQNPLVAAVCYNNKEVVPLLLAAGCDINVHEIGHDETALHIAIKKKYTYVVEELLGYTLSSTAHTMNMLTTCDLDVNKHFYLLGKEAGQNRTLFHVAVDRQYFETCHLLASLGFADYSLGPRFLAILGLQVLSESDHLHLLSVLKILSSPPILKYLCRNVIRSCIGHDLLNTIPSLPIPPSLIEFLLFRTEHQL